MTQVPPRALVVGGGVVGVEFATILAGLGSAVTLLVRGNTLLRNCEPEARELVEQSLRSKGVKIHFETELSAVARPVAGGPVTATFHGQTIEVDEIVVAAGRRANTDNIGLETVGLPGGGFVSVNDHLQAIGVTGDWLYALGDTTGRALLSHISRTTAASWPTSSRPGPRGENCGRTSWPPVMPAVLRRLSSPTLK